MSKKIYLSPSSQPENAYAYGNTNEQEQCRRIADACEVALKRCGFEVKNNTAADMYGRVADSDKWGADLHVPIHTNAHNGQTTGTRIFCYNSTGEGNKASQAVFNVLAPITPGTSENVRPNATLYEISEAYAPTVYIEVDFHDVPNIAKWIIENVETIGEAIAKGICNYYGVTFVEKPEPESKVLYKVQVGAYAVRANADKMLEKLKSAGFNGFIVTVEK